MRSYIAHLDLAGELTEVKFETDILPVEWLWQRYGMSTFIADLTEEGAQEEARKGD